MLNMYLLMYVAIRIAKSVNALLFERGCALSKLSFFSGFLRKEYDKLSLFAVYVEL